MRPIQWRTTMTDKVRDTLIAAAGRGCNQLECAIQASVHPSVLDKWVTSGRRTDGDPLYQDLVIRMGQALIERKLLMREEYPIKITGSNWYDDTRKAYEELALDMSGRDILDDFYGVNQEGV